MLDNLIVELEKAGTWPNLVTILATKAVVAGRLNDRELMDESIDRARSLVNEKLDDDSRPPAEFLLESAHALYYLGALAGHDPETIERKIRDTISSIG